MNEFYGLEAQFQFGVDPQSKTNLSWVRSQLGGIETAVESLSSSMERNNIASQFKTDATQTQRATRRMTGAVDQMSDAMKVAAKRIDPLKREFRALRAEVRLVDFGDITDDRQFKKATNEVRNYITSLQRLETQIRGDTTAEREFTAQLKQQQRVMSNRLEMQEQQRIASQASARVGEFQVVQQAGKFLVNDKVIGQAKDAINVFSKFDDTMSSVAAITGATGNELDALREKAKEMGATTRFTAYQAAEAESFLGSAGFNAQAILAGVPATLNLASAGALDLGEAADIASNVLSGMQLKIEDLGHTTDVLAFTAAAANTNIQQMGVAMSYAAPNAALFGATVEETAALMGVMSNAGIQADKAGTAARGAFLRMASPVKQGKAALAEMGMTLTDSSGNMKNIIDIFNELDTRLKISPETLKSIQDAGEDIESLGTVSQSKQIEYLKGIFGTTGISGAAAALSQIHELNRLAIAGRASSSSMEQLKQYFTEIQGIKLAPGQDLFGVIIDQAPSYQDAVRQIDEANLALLQVNLKTLNGLDSRRLTEYFQQVKGIAVAPGGDLLGAVTANAPDSQNAIDQITTAMQQLGIEVKGQVGAAQLMAQVMENNLAGSFRSLGSAMEAVQVNFIEPLTPLIRAVVDVATKAALFLANLPTPVRTAISVTAALTIGMGALAVAIGAVGVTLFGFQQAMAVTNLASASLASNLIPLTGFFETSQKAIIATNPLETFFQRNTQLAGDFEKAAAGTFDETIAGMKTLSRQAVRTGQAFLAMSRSMLLSPIGLSIGGFLLLNTLLEQVVPGFNLLGTVLGAIAAPFGFIYGFIKGITHSLLDFLGLTGSGAMGAVAPIFGTITNAIELAAKSFTLFAASGERIGERLGQAIVTPFVLAGQVITTAWGRTIAFIRGLLSPFAAFVQRIGQMLIGFLAEASPGPTYWIRRKWAMTVQFLQGLFTPLLNLAQSVGALLSGALSPVSHLFSGRRLDIGVTQSISSAEGGLPQGKRESTGIEGLLHEIVTASQESVKWLTWIGDNINAATVDQIPDIQVLLQEISPKREKHSQRLAAVAERFPNEFSFNPKVVSSVLKDVGYSGNLQEDQAGDFVNQLVRLKLGNTGSPLSTEDPRVANQITKILQQVDFSASDTQIIPQLVNAVQNLEPGESGSGLEQYFTKSFSAIQGNWSKTSAFVSSNIDSLVNTAMGQGHALQGALSEASPGPTYWIRRKWAMTVQFLQGLFERLKTGAIAIGQQLSSTFTSVLPQLPNAISIVTVLAELSGLLNPVEGLAIAIGNTIFGGIVESMGKSLDQVIPIFIRRLSLVAAFGGFLAQRLNFIQPLQARIIAGLAILTSLSTLYFKNFSIDVTNIWHSTVQAIQGDLQALAGLAKNVGLLLISFLAEASPGPTYWIRQKWAMTVEFLQELFRRISAAAGLVNQAFLGIGDVTADQRMLARQTIFQGVIFTIVSGVKSLFLIGRALTWVYDNLQRVVSSAIANFDLLSFSLLTVASLPATMIPLLQEGFEQVIPQMALLAGQGIPRAILLGLPGVVAIATSSGLVKGFEQGFAAFVAGVPARSAAFSNAVYTMFDQAGVKGVVNQGLSEGVTAFVRSLPDELGGREDFTFNFDFDTAYAAYEEQRNTRVAALVSYLQQVGVVANQVGAQLQAALAPILSFQIQGIPVIPFFSVILPFRDALVSLASSPAVLGFIGFLSGTVLPTVARTLAAIASTVLFIFNTFVTLPVAAAINVLTREAVAATRAIIQASIAFVAAIPAVLAQGVVILAQTTVQAIASLLAQIPYIGQFLSQAFLGSVDFLVATTQVYFRLLSSSFQRFTAQIAALLGPAYKQLATEIIRGTVYIFQQGLKPLGSLLIRALNPASAFKLIGLYLRTKGFAGVFKPGLFMINPFDLLFGGIPGISAAARLAALTLLGIPFPAGIVARKTAEVFQIYASGQDILEAKLKSRKLDSTILVPLEKILKTQPAIARFFFELFRGVLMINPLVQIIGRIALTTLFWYAALKPITPEMFNAIAATQILGHSLAPVANLLRVMRFLVVDVGEAFLGFVKAIPPFIRATQQLFNLFGTITGVAVHEVVGMASIVLNIFKATFGNLFLVVSIGFAEALKLTLVNMQWWASFLRLKTQQYGDAIVAALHGHLGPLIHQVFSDIAQGVTILFQRTVGVAARAIASVAVRTVDIVGATFQEIGRLIRDPIGESIRLFGLFQDAVNRTFGGIVATINTYIQQLQLDRLARFLGHFWIQIAALADVLLLVTGVLNPLQFIITALIGLGIFLINEYQTGFQTLDAIIAGLAHPIEFVTNAINAMIGALGVYIPPELTQFISGVTEQFVKSLPIIAGGVFLLALLIRRNIGQAFQDVVGGVMKIVGGVMQAVEATRIFGGVVRETATSAQVQTQVGAQVHQVRRRESFLGVRNPFVYSQNEKQQGRAVALGDERVAKSRAALRYQDEMNKSLAKITKEEEDEVKRLARSRNARDQIMAFGGRLQRDDGFSYDVAPLLEKKKGLFGLEKLELSETGRAKVAQQARRRLYQSDSEDAQGKRARAASASGLDAAFERHGGGFAPDELLKTLAQQGDYGVTNLLSAFQKAMENLHVGEFQANKLYVAEFVRPKDLSSTRPVNPRAFDLQLEDFRGRIKNPADLAILQAATPTQKIDQRISDVVAKNNPVTAGTDYKKIFNDVYINLLKQIDPGATANFESRASKMATDLVQAAEKGANEFKKTRERILNEITQVQFALLNDEISDFNKFEDSNIAALKEAQRNIEGFHPIATNSDVLSQAVRNIAGQTQAEIEQANKTRRSLFSTMFGFTGVPQLIENFQYNQRLFRRTQRISRIVEQMATGESRERTIAEEARRRGLSALMSNAGYKFPQESVQFYALKKINAQEQAFIESWINNKNFKVDITQHAAFKPEADKILANFNKLSKQLTFKTLEDVKRFQELLTENVPKAERENLKKLQQYILHGATQKPTGSQLSFAERDNILGAINQTLFSTENQKLFSGFGFKGDQNEKVTSASLKGLRDDYDTTINRLTSRFMENGQFIAEIGGKNEYIEGAYKDLEEKLGLGKGSSLRKIQNVKLKNTVRQIGVNLELFEQDIRLRVLELRDGVSNALDSFESWLAARSPFPSLAPRIVNLIRDPFNALSNNIGELYNAQKASLGGVAEQIRADFIGSKLISRISRINKQYKDARDLSLQTILEASRDTRVATLARQGHTSTQLRNVREKLTRQQFTQAQSGQAMTALMRGAMSKEAVRAMLGQELRRQGLSREQVSTEIDKVLSQFGTQARYSVGDILKMRGLDASKVSKALESTLSLEAKEVEKILTNPNYTARAVAPFQLFLVREIPGLIKDTAKGFVGTINKFGGGAIARLAGIVAKDIAIGFKGEFLNTLAVSTRTLTERLGVGANNLALSMERIVGKNPLSDAVRGFSDFLRARGKATADFLKAQALTPDDARSLTKVIKNRTIELFKTIGSAIQSAQAAIQGQGGGVFGAIKALFGGLKGFFGKLFNRRQNPQLAQLDAQIQQQRDRATKARELQRRAQTVADERVDPWVRDASRKMAQRQYDVAQGADAKGAQLQRQRDLTATFLQPRYSGAGTEVAKAVGSVMGRVGKIYEDSATKLGQRVTQLNRQTVPARTQRIGQTSEPVEAPPGTGGFFRQYRQGVVDNIEFILPKTTKLLASLTGSAQTAAAKMGNYFKGSALRSETAWEESANHITGNSWWAMTKRAVWTGMKIVTNLNHGAADVTAAAWNRSEQSVTQDMHQMAQTAQQTGQQISQSMEQSAKKSGGFFSHLGNSIGKVGKAGMAIGAGITAVGFGAQTAMYSLSTMGIIDEETQQSLYKFFEIFTLVGAVGGIVTPIFTALVSSLGAIGSVALAAASGIAGIGGAIAPLIGLGGVAFAPFLIGIAAAVAAFGGLYLAVRTNFLGIGSLVQGLASFLGSVLSGPISLIERGWQGFVDRFGSKLMPIIQPAINIAQGLINALNHNPTEKIPAAWDIAGERIKGVLDSILGAGQAVGNGLVSFFTPIVALFNPIANLFKKKEEKPAKTPYPELSATPETPESPEKGILGNIMGAITSLVMLPVNLIKGIADWIGGVVGGIVKQIIGVLIGPVQWVAEALRPLQMPIAQIELFFKNLVSIVQSVVYLNAVMRPLAENAISINATINQIAKFFYSLRSIIESVEFLYAHVFNRKALAPGAGQGGKGVDPSKSPTNFRGSPAEGYQKTGAKAIQDLTLQEAAGEVQGIFKNAMDIKGNVGAVFNGFKTGLGWLGSAWQFTMGMIKGETGTLVTDTEAQGYHLQKNLSEGSPGPTYWIRQNWEKTTQALQGWMGNLTGESKKAGSEITANLTPDPVTPHPTISPVVDSPRQATGFTALKANAIAAIDSITSEVQAKYEMLERQGVGGIGALFMPGLNQTIKNVAILSGDMMDFAKRSTIAIATLNFGELSDAARDFGGNFAYTAQGVLAGFGQMGAGAIAFGLYTIASISPFLVILGGVAFTAAVIVANFLGLRTIMGGAFRIGIGLGQIFISIITGIINVGRSLGMILGGVFLAMRGDFSLLEGGIAQLKAAFQGMGRGIVRGLNTIKAGFIQILRGIKEGITQIFPMFPEWIGQLKSVAIAFRNPERAGEMVAEVLIGAFNRVKNAIKAIPTLLGRIPGLIRGQVDSVLLRINDVAARIWTKAKEIYTFFRALSFSGIVDRFITEFRDIPKTLAQLPRQILARIEQAIPALKAPFNYIRGFAHGFVRRIAAELPPDFVNAVSAALSAGTAKIRLIFTNLSGDVVMIIRQIVAKLGMEEQFARVLRRVSDRWKAFTAWLKQGNLFSWLPRTTQEFSDLFVATVSKVEGAWKRFTQWLSSTPFFSNLFAQIEKLSQRFTQGMGWLGQKWSALQEKLAVPNLFASFFERLRGLGDKFSNTIIWLDEKWRNFATRFNLPVFQGIFDNLWALGERFKQLVTFIENRWNQLATFLSTTPIVDWAIQGVQFLGRTFTKVIQFVQRQWVPFVTFLSSSNLFPAIFEKLRRFGSFIPQIVERVKGALTNLPSTASAALTKIGNLFLGVKNRAIAAFANIGQYAKGFYEKLPQPLIAAVDRIQNRWKEFSAAFKPILEPIVGFANWVADKLIKALNCSPTVKIPAAWEVAVDNIIATLKLLIEPARRVGRFITETFGFVFDFLKAIGNSFYQSIAPSINRILLAIKNIRQGATAADEVGGLFQGITIYFKQLRSAIKPVTDLFDKFITKLRGATAESQGAVSAGQSLGKAFARMTLGVLNFTIRAIPPLLKALAIIVRFTIEVVAFAAKVAYALRFIASYFTRVGFAAVESVGSILRFARSAWTATERIRGAFDQLKADVQKFVTSFKAGMADLGRAVRRLVGAFLDVFAPQLKPVLKRVVTDFEGFASLIRFALVDLISTAVERIQKFYQAVRGMSPFQMMEQGVQQARRALTSLGKVLQQIGRDTGITPALTSIVSALAPIAKWLGITTQNAQEMKQVLKSSGTVISSSLTEAGTKVKQFFDNLSTRAKEAIEPFVIYYRAAFEDLADRVRSSFPFQFLESGFRQIKEVGSAALTIIQAGAERVAAIFRQVLVALNLDVPFDAAVAAVQRFRQQSESLVDWALLTLRKGVEQATDSIKQQFIDLGERITDVIAQSVAQIYVKFTSIGDGVKAVTEEIASRIGGVFDRIKASVSQALIPYAPIIDALRDVLSAIQKIGSAIAELIGDVTVFGVKVDSIVTEVILNFGKATWAVIDFAGKVLAPMGLIGIVTAIFNISVAIKDLIVNVGKLVGEAIPPLGKLGTAIKDLLLVPLEAIGSIWNSTIGKIRGAVSGLSEKSQGEGEQLAQAVGELPARKSWQFWKRTTQAIHAEVESLAEELKIEGHEIQAAISEGSPGTTERIRFFWKKTVGFVGEQIGKLGQIAKGEGAIIQNSLSNATRIDQTSNIRQLQDNIEGVSERNQQLANTTQSLLGSIGSVLSNFAPQLATPLFMVNDFIQAFFDIKKAIPEIKAMIQGTESVTVASNAAIAVSEAVVAQTANSSAITLVTGAAETGAAKTAEAAVVGGANSWMAATYGFLAGAAKNAYRSMIVPLISFLPIILGVSAGIFLLYKAFQTNFTGIGDVVQGVTNFVKEFFGLLFAGAWQTLASIFINIEHQIHAIGRTLRRVGNILMEPFRPLFAAFGISGGRSPLGNAMVATISLILLPLRLAAGAINLIINLLSRFIQGVILIGGIILNFILLPIRLINATIYGIVMGFNSMMLGINQAINLLLLAPLSIATSVAYEVARAIAGVGRIITNFVLAPFFAIQNAIMRVIGPVVDFVLRSIGSIAGAAALIFTILNPGLVIGTFVTFITGATLVARAIQFVLGIPLKAIGFLWKNTVGKMLGFTQGFVVATKGFGEQLKTILSDPTAAIRESWKTTIEFIQAKLTELGVTARVEGQDVTRSLVQALPGGQAPMMLPGAITPPAPKIAPKPQLNAHLQTLGLNQDPQDLAELKRAYRQQAKLAHPDAGGDVEQFRRVQDAYEQLKTSMEAPSRNSVAENTAVIEQATKKVGTLSERMRGLGSGFGSTLGSMGSAISNFSPQLAAPFFILSDFIDAILSVEGLLPGLKAFFAGKKIATVADAAVTTAANGAIASSNLLVAGTAASTAIVVSTGAEVSAVAVTTEATAVGGANTFMATTYGILANAARWAYSSILMPLVPLLPTILGVAAAVGLLYLAFKTNFLGIGDVVKGLVGGVLLVFGVAWGVAKGVWDAISSVFGTLMSSLGEIFAAIGELASALLKPFAPLLALFGGNGAGGGSLGDAISATVKFILIPVKLVADGLSWIIKGITFLIVGVIKLATAIVTKIFSPIAEKLNFLAPVARLLRTIIGAVGGITIGVMALLGVLGIMLTVVVPLLISGATMLFGLIAAGMGFLISTAIPLLIQGLISIATVAIPLLFNAIWFIATVAVPAVISGLIAIATTAIPMIMTALSGLIPFIITGFGFVISTIIPAIGAGLIFIATVAIPAIISGIIGLVTAAIPLMITFAPIILAVLAIVAVVWVLKKAFDAVFQRILKFIPFVVQGFQRIAPIVLSPFTKLWELIKGIISSIGNLFSNTISGVKNFFQNLPLVGRLFGGGQSPENAPPTTDIQQFAGGGLVQGQGTQAIPVIAHAGEFVVTPEATRANLGVLEYLNAGGQLALPTPSVGIMPSMPLALPAPVAVPTTGGGNGTVVIENVNLNFEVQINTNNGAEAGDEFLRYIEDPRFKRAVRQALRETVERMK